MTKRILFYDYLEECLLQHYTVPLEAHKMSSEMSKSSSSFEKEVHRLAFSKTEERLSSLELLNLAHRINLGRLLALTDSLSQLRKTT